MSRFSCEVNSPEVERAVWNAVSTILAPRIFSLDYSEDEGVWIVTVHTGKKWTVYNGGGPGTVNDFGLEEIHGGT